MNLKEKLNRITGLLLAVVILAGMFPFSAVAEETRSYTSNVIGPLQVEEDFGEPDPSADLEGEGDFVASLKNVRLKGLTYNEKLFAVAKSQLGYSES